MTETEPKEIQSEELDYKDVREKPYDKLTRAEARLRIAQAVGLNTNPDTRFGKRESNSIHAYITGGFWCDPKLFYQNETSRGGNRHDPSSAYTMGGTPRLASFKRQIVRAVRDRLEADGGLTDADRAALSYDPGPPEKADRGFKVRTLRRLAEYVESHSDQRPSPSPRQ